MIQSSPDYSCGRMIIYNPPLSPSYSGQTIEHWRSGMNGARVQTTKLYLHIFSVVLFLLVCIWVFVVLYQRSKILVKNNRPLQPGRFHSFLESCSTTCLLTIRQQQYNNKTGCTFQMLNALAYFLLQLNSIVEHPLLNCCRKTSLLHFLVFMFGK